MLATGENSSNCQEESCTFPVADNYFNLQDIYSLCQEETGNMTLCACGCGQEIVLKVNHKWRGVPRYISGYNPPWNKGKKGTFYHSEDAKMRIAKSRKGQLSWNRGKKRCFSEEALKRRSVSRGDLSGEANPNWRGGIAFLPYCPKFNKELKERIRERDNRTCQLCGIRENGKKLRIHHIHYDKPNCEPDLIALCHSCHAKTNGNRDYYETLFMEKLTTRGLI